MTDFVNIERIRHREGFTYYHCRHATSWSVFSIEGKRGDWEVRIWQGQSDYMLHKLRIKARAAGVRLSEVSDLFKSQHDDKPFEDYPDPTVVASGKTLKDIDDLMTYEYVKKIEHEGIALFESLMEQDWGREVPQRTALKLDVTCFFQQEEYRNVLDHVEHMYDDTSEECVKQWLESEVTHFIQSKLEKLENRRAFTKWKAEQDQKTMCPPLEQVVKLQGFDSEETH